MNSPILAHPEFYATLVFNSSDLISILSPDGVYKFVTNSVEPILGYAPAELVSTNALAYIHPDDVPIVADALSDLQLRQTIHISPFRFKAKNGEWRWMDCVIKDMTADSNVKGVVSNARDVTEKVEAERQLEMREAYYTSLFRNHPDGAFALTPDGIIITANPGLEPVLGLPADEIVGCHYADFILPGTDTAPADNALYKALNGESGTFEIQARHKDKDMVWLNITAIPVLLNGEVVGVHGIAKDITRIKNAQNVIKEQAELLGSVFSSITDGFFVVDKQWKLKYYNPFFTTFFGLPGLGLEGQELWQLVPELKNSRFYAACMHAAQTGSSAYLHELFPDRQQILRFAIYPFSGGFTVYFEDETQQKKQEQELFDLSLVASKTTNGVAIMNAEGKIEWVNNSFTRLTGFTREEAIGWDTNDLLRRSAADPEVAARIYRQYAARVPFSQEVLNYRKNGEEIWFNIDVTPVFDEAGQLIKYVAIENDITELKQKETERLKLTENLLRRNEALQQFTYMVSHNLRAPVANLLGLARLLNRENKNSEKFDLALVKLATASLHLDSVINNLTRMLEPGKAEEETVTEMVNIHSIINAVADGLQEQMIQVKASLDNRTNPRLNLPGCQAYFYSVFQNLFDNALKFRNPYKPLIITVSQQQVSGKITILFSDNGIGMDLDRVQDQLFKQHQRFHAETEGHGMGLYLVKTQVEAMGGTVRVESRPGAGSTFLLTFSLKGHAQ